jgi:hypothetical protein
MPVRHARSETRGRHPLAVVAESARAVRRDPQRIWKQRDGHTRSRYLADEDQASAVLLHALSVCAWRRHL